MSQLTWQELEKQRELDLSRQNRYKLDKYVIKDGKKHPFALIIPGGGYDCVANWVEGLPFALELNKKGISAFVLFYPCKEKSFYPAPHNAVAKALRHIFKNAEKYHLDTTKYMMWGSSAGGHLAASYMVDFDTFTPEFAKPNLGVLIYPVITMGNQTHWGTKNNIIGINASEEMKDKLTPSNNVTSDTPPMFIWCGDADVGVPPVNSQMMAQALEEHNIPYRLRIYPDVGHGVGLGYGQSCEGWLDDAVDFFCELTK